MTRALYIVAALGFALNVIVATQHITERAMVTVQEAEKRGKW